MDRTPQRSAAPTRVRGRRALTLAVALTLPLLSACGPDDTTGFAALAGAPGDAQLLISGAVSGDEPDEGCAALRPVVIPP